MSRARDKAKTRHHGISFHYLQKHMRLEASEFLVALLSSLAWDRNFSVVNSGFFSSRIRFQKLENLASADRKEKNPHNFPAL